MSKLEQAARMSLDALDDQLYVFPYTHIIKAITALREALDHIGDANEMVEAEQQEPALGQPLPCPFCGHTGLDFSDGSTYRWGIASCCECGATCGEVRREYPDKGEWHREAIVEWNRRYTHLQAREESIPLSAIRAIAVEAIRAITGCPDIKGNGRYLVDEIEDVAKAAAESIGANP